MRCITTRLRSVVFLVAILGGLMLASCDYPEQGYFQLIAFDGYGEPVAAYPFAIEELVDDTAMTTGFRVLLPIEGELLELDMDDASDLTRRAWSLQLNDCDYGVGDLDLVLSHAAGRLGFTGAYRPPQADTPEQMIPAPPVAQAIGGYVVSKLDGAEGDVLFGGKPPVIPLAPGAVDWRIERITRDSFETILGCAIDDAVRILSTPRDALEAVQELDETQSQLTPADDGQADEDGDEQDGAEEAASNDDEQSKQQEKRKPKSPPLGGRGGSRPR